MASHHIDREIARSHGLVNHAISHPNGTPIHQHWAEEQTLHVAVMYSNPCRWATRTKLCNDALRHLRALPNLRVYVGELAYGDRPFEVTSSSHPLDFQWRTREMLWHKENVLNQVIRRFAPSWEYGAYIDADFHFTRLDVGLETIHQLQRYDWVQMFSTYSDLSPNHRPMRILKSFGRRFSGGELDKGDLLRWQHGDPHGYGTIGRDAKLPKRKPVGTTGAAWAFRRDSFVACGGLLDTCILGSGDWHMAFGLSGEPDQHPNVAEMVKCGRNYAESIKIWQTRAATAVRKNVGCVDCHAVHYFHGSKQLRGYGTRWKILRDHDYDPYRDIYPDENGVYQLRPDRVGLRDDIRRYFDSRSEDSTHLYSDDRELGDDI